MKQLLILGSLLCSLWMTGQVVQPDLQKVVVLRNPTGVVIEQGYLVGELRDSIWTHYDPAGHITSTAYFCKGVKIGTWLIKTEDHFIRITYDHGVKVLYEEVSFLGRVITSVKF